MALFGLIGDGSDSSGYDASASPFLMPMAAQALRYDPRSLLIQSMLQNSQQQLNQPTYNTGSAIAKALTQGIAGISSAYLQNQYADAAKGAPEEIGAALQSKDPLTALTQSKNPVARMMGFQLAPQVMAKRLTPVTLGPGQQQYMPGSSTPLTTNTAPLSEPGKLAHDIGNTTPIQAQTDLTTATKNAENTSDLNYKPKIAGATKIAEIPGTVGAAVGTAAGTAPIDTFKELFKPQVNRVTGEVSIPGLSDPAAVQAVMKSFGVTASALGGTRVAGVPASPQPNGAPPAPSPAIVAPAQGAAPTAAVSPAGPAAIGGGGGGVGINAGAGAAPQPSPIAHQGPSPQASPAAPVPVGTMNPVDEVPKVPLPTGEMAKQPGTISAGRDPVAIHAGEEGVTQAAKQYEETADAAKAATNMNAQLGAMKSLLEQGKLITNAAGPAREEVAGWIYAGTGNAQLAQSLTGINPAAADVFKKESTRLGFNLARQLGAREAAQIVQGAIKANPNLAATPEGNKMVISTLMAGAQHDIDAQTYSDAWFQKNGHYVGAQGWFNKNHPVIEYTSKAIPFQIPRLGNGQVDTSKLEPNVTYQGANGLGIWNGHGFIPVNQ